MILPGIRHGAFTTALTMIALAAAGCAGHPSATSVSYPVLDGAQLKTALLANSDMPAGFTNQPSHSGNVNPDVTSSASSHTSAAPTAAGTSDPTCARLESALDHNASAQGGEGFNAYADTGFQTSDAADMVSESLEAYPADNLTALRSWLSLVQGSMARCSTLTTAQVTASASAISEPTLGDGSAWFSITDTLGHGTIRLAMVAIIVGNVGITLTVGNGPGNTDPVTELETLAHKAVAKVTSLQKQVG